MRKIGRPSQGPPKKKRRRQRRTRRGRERGSPVADKIWKRPGFWALDFAVGFVFGRKQWLAGCLDMFFSTLRKNEKIPY